MINGRVAVDHVGITVPDLDEAVSFFVDVFGCEVVFYAGPYDDCGYIWPGETKPENTTVRLVMLTHGGTHNIELLEYSNRPIEDRQTDLRPADRGGRHLAFYVEDIETVVEQLKQRDDIHILGALEKEVVGGPIDGTDWVYIMTRWGLVIELMRWEPGKLPYEADTSARMIPPRWFR